MKEFLSIIQNINILILIFQRQTSCCKLFVMKISLTSLHIKALGRWTQLNFTLLFTIERIFLSSHLQSKMKFQSFSTQFIKTGKIRSKSSIKWLDQVSLKLMTWLFIQFIKQRILVDFNLSKIISHILLEFCIHQYEK